MRQGRYIIPQEVELFPSQMHCGFGLRSLNHRCRHIESPFQVDVSFCP